MAMMGMDFASGLSMLRMACVASYPDITVTVEGVTNYAEDSLTRLQSGDWGDIMLIPEVNKKDLASYFCSFGDLDTVSSQVNYASK